MFIKPDFYYYKNNKDDKQRCSSWWRGYKLRFNGAVKDMPLYKEEGYFPRSYLEQVNIDECLHVNSWYLSGSGRNEDEAKQRQYAMTILMRCLNCTRVSAKSLFLVRPSRRIQSSTATATGGHSITFTHLGKILHIKINEIMLLQSHMKKIEVKCSGILTAKFHLREANEASLSREEMKRFYCINDCNYFLSIVDLINFYKENQLENFLNGSVLSLGVSFREAMPTPLYAAKYLGKSDLTSNGIDSSKVLVLELEVGEKFFVVKDEGECEASMLGWVYAFNVNAMLGYVWREHLEEIF
jgi:hypothetical protein